MKKMIRMFTFVIPFAFMIGMLTESKAQEGIWNIGPRMLLAAADTSNEIRESPLNTRQPDVEAKITGRI